jgi:hypothetical protein
MGPDEPPAYTYQPLDAAKQEIRLLDVLRSEASPPVFSCRLRHVSIAGKLKPVYETISHCWGDSTRSTEIYIDSRVLKVPVNTALALQYCARHSRLRTLRIDAVCINQDDVDERGQQVAIMGSIFKGGMRNTIFLGAEEGLTQRALANLAAVRRKIVPDDMVLPGFGALQRGSLSFISTPLDGDALIDLFGCPWFQYVACSKQIRFTTYSTLRRLWVVQESVLARENICVRGETVSDLQLVLDGACLLVFQANTGSIPSSHVGFRGILCACLIYQSRREYTVSPDYMKGISLGYLLLRSPEMLCSDPRDHVYGILGIAQPVSYMINPLRADMMAQLLIQDYRKPTLDMYCDATRYSLIAGRGMSTLPLIHLRDEGDLTEGRFPSWVPRYSRAADKATDPIALANEALGTSMHSDFIMANYPLAPEHPGVLYTPGFTAGIVTACSPCLEWKPGADSCEMESIRAFFQACWDIATQDRTAESEESLARVLTAGSDSSGLFWAGDRLHLLAFKKHILEDRKHLLPLARLFIARRDDSMIKASGFWHEMEHVSKARKLIGTEHDLLALAPKITKAGI